MEIQNKRITWIDVAKFIGMFSIYIGHFSEKAGHSYLFVFAFHVPLFFFLSGCTESFNKEKSIYKNIKKRTVTIMIPFVFYSLLSLIVYVINTNCGLYDVAHQLILIAKGAIRNTYFASTLWFLTCLFVISILFDFIKKVSSKIIMFIICLILYFINILCLRSTPKWFFNIDSALLYIIYYCLGYILFDKINIILLKKFIFLFISGIISFIFTSMLFFEQNLLQFAYSTPFIQYLVPIISTLIVIWFVIIISYLCKNINCFTVIGENSLYLCGNEYIVKTIILCAVQIPGFSINIQNPLCAYIYTAILIQIVTYYFAPFQKKILLNIKHLIINMDFAHK